MNTVLHWCWAWKLLEAYQEVLISPINFGYTVMVILGQHSCLQFPFWTTRKNMGLRRSPGSESHPASDHGPELPGLGLGSQSLLL